MRLIFTGLTALESVDEEAVLYLRSASEADNFVLSPVALTPQYPAIQAQIEAVSQCSYQ